MTQQENASAQQEKSKLEQLELEVPTMSWRDLGVRLGIAVAALSVFAWAYHGAELRPMDLWPGAGAEEQVGDRGRNAKADEAPNDPAAALAAHEVVRHDGLPVDGKANT